MLTACRDCQHVRKDKGTYYCLAVRLRGVFDFYNGVNTYKYCKCAVVNDNGRCPLYKSRIQPIK